MKQLILLVVFVVWDVSTSRNSAELNHNLAVSFGVICASLFLSNFLSWMEDR